MAGEEAQDGGTPKDVGRRALLKAATVAGGAAVASALLPGAWRKPTATIGGLPAHAQTSQELSIEFTGGYAWWSSYTGASATRNGFTGKIDFQFNYNDALGDMDKSDHNIVYAITPVNGTVYGPVTSLLKDVYVTGFGDGATGQLNCRVLTPHPAGGTISWHIEKGATHRSNQVSADVVFD